MACCLKTSLSAVSLLFTLTLSASAQPFTYTNARFGTSVTFPDEVFSQQSQPPANGDGMTFLVPDGASLAIYGSNNALEQTPDQLADFVSEAHSVTYRKVGRTGWCFRAATATRSSTSGSNSARTASSTRSC